MSPVVGRRNRTAPPGRIRQYAKSTSPLARLDTRTPDTPEGALSGHNESDWHVASGDEPYFRQPGQRQAPERDDDDDTTTHGSQPFGLPYRLTDFASPATDEKGHDRHAKVTFSPELLNEIVAVVRSGKFPLESVDHFIRVACFELLRVLEHIEPIENSHIAILETMNRINENAKVLLAYEHRVQVAVDLISMLLGRGMETQARIALHDQLENAKLIKVKEVRERVLAELKSKFKGVLKGQPVNARVVKRNVPRARREHAE